MAKSLEELELAFKAQYPKVEKKRRFKKQSPVDRQVEAIQKETTQAIRPEDMALRTVKEVPGMTSKEELEGAGMTSKEGLKGLSMATEDGREVASATSQKEEADNKTTFSIRDLVFYSILVLMIVSAIIFSKEVLGNQSIVGRSFYEVTTTSMQSVYPKGSLVFVKDIDPNALVVGDDIAFTNEDSEIIISRIIEIKEEIGETNNQVFVTLGVNEQDGDSEEVLANKVIGKATSGIPMAGAILNWIGSNLLLVFVILGAIIVILVSTKLFKRKGNNSKKD